MSDSAEEVQLNSESTNPASNSASRREVLVFGGTVLTSVIGAYLTSRWTVNRLAQHTLSVEFVKREDAADPEPPGLGDVLMVPSPTPEPGPESQYSYTVTVRNVGDYTESDVVIAIRFGVKDPDFPTAALVKPVTVRSSLQLLGPQVIMDQPNDDLEYRLTMNQLVRGEWVSLDSTWRVPMGVLVEARSTDSVTSAFL